VIVFTNELPDFKLMSPDRWRVFTLGKDNKLAVFDVPPPASSESDEEGQ
jgi:hypothetical protein